MFKPKLIIAVMYSDEKIYSEAVLSLKEKFGEIITKSKPYDFNFTDYYSKEMGFGLIKRFVVFDKRIEKKGLAQIRMITGEIENKFRIKGKRQINLDPGYISSSEVVLASLKGQDFKEDLGNGVFAHRIYSFGNTEIKIFPHTFPDYKVETNKKFFLSLRNRLYQ